MNQQLKHIFPYPCRSRCSLSNRIPLSVTFYSRKYFQLFFMCYNTSFLKTDRRETVASIGKCWQRADRQLEISHKKISEIKSFVGVGFSTKPRAVNRYPDIFLARLQSCFYEGIKFYKSITGFNLLNNY